MASSASFTSPSGGAPEEYIITLARDAVPTEGDALYAAQRQRTRIIERTLAGRDVDGSPFEPYSQSGPYYYYPNGRVGRNKIEARKNRAAVSRLLKRVGEVESFTGKDIGGVKTRNGEGIRFESYAAFKASLGRSGVDLLGPRAPHMLQAIAVGVGAERVAEDVPVGIFDLRTPARQAVIGIYGDEAGRASGHNTGVNPRWKGRHRRYFLGASELDLAAMGDDILQRCIMRIKALDK